MDRAKLVLPLIALSLIACGNKKIVGYKDNYIERKIYESTNDEEERLTTLLTVKYNKKNLPEERISTRYPKEDSNSIPRKKSITTYKYDKKWRLIEESKKTLDITTDTVLNSTIITYTYNGNTTITKTIVNNESGIVVEAEEKVTTAKIKGGKKKETTLNSKIYEADVVTDQSTETKTEIFDKFNRKVESRSSITEDYEEHHSETTRETIVTFENAGDNYTSKEKSSVVKDGKPTNSSSRKEIGKFEKSEFMSNSEIVQYNYNDNEFKTVANGRKNIRSKDSKNNTETEETYSLDLNVESNDEEKWALTNVSFFTFTFDSKTYGAMTSKTSTYFNVNDDGDKVKDNFTDVTYTNDEYGRCIESCNTSIIYKDDGETILNKRYSREESKYDKPIPIYKK